ncbi:uncharacterized protein LOC131426984 [Malaya genurostris]|uniref:uncharacterized protein LOC131426984 n=1 Tax=Malaya genurostris TaxID=325434 RepID=UPI0026F3D75C|nr:uncharacterized protein LOC131426984 [Malaya genurostris]
MKIIKFPVRISPLVVLLVCIEALYARSISERKRDYDYEFDGTNAASYHGSKSGYSAGSGLRSIAQGSADQANNAVVSQVAAAKQAAYVAQSTLAQAASQAAATAQAALEGKQVLLQGLEHQSIEAHQALENEIAQLHQAKKSAKAAQYAAQQALNHVQVLTAALNNAQVASEHTQQAANEASTELASQNQMVGTAKARVESIEEQLRAAQVDYEATLEAAHKAAGSAQEAQKNAAEAASYAAIQHPIQLDPHSVQFQSKASKQQQHEPEDDINSGEIDVGSNRTFG